VSPPLSARYRRIVIEGPIGVGKTSLARRLAQHLGAHLALEQPEANPFLARFYQDRARYALPTQLFFLFQRSRALRELDQPDLFRTTVVGDYLFDKDPLFARLTLGDDELRLYEEVLARIAPPPAPPDLVLYLQADPATLFERVRRRGNPVESAITEDYLRALADSYLRLFHRYDAAPVLIVNTENLNPVDDADDFALLLARVEGMRGRREYFNVGTFA
jgi:deoxyadenosine/deoxycytidine kinase